MRGFGGNDTFAFTTALGAVNAADADDRVIYNNATGQLLFDPDGVGGTAQIQFAYAQRSPCNQRQRLPGDLTD